MGHFAYLVLTEYHIRPVEFFRMPATEQAFLVASIMTENETYQQEMKKLERRT